MMRSLSLLALLVACGDDESVRVLPDADGADGAPDAPRGVATLTIRIGGVPAVGHTVYFQAPDGAELAIVQTDANGRASAVVPANSSVTTLDVYNSRARDGHNVVTILGVQPGDDLNLAGDFGLAQVPVQVTFPAFTDIAMPRYSLFTTCGRGSATTPSTVIALAQCNPRIDTVAVARIDETGEALAYIARLDQPASATIDLSGETWAALPTVTSTYTNIPPFDYSSVVQRSIRTARGPIVECSGRGGTAPSFAVQLTCPVIAGTTAVDIVAWGDVTANREVIHPISTTTSPTFDLAGAQVQSPLDYAFDLATRSVTWNQDSVGATPDFVRLEIESRNRDLDWRVIAPYAAARSITLPPLLGEAASVDLDATDAPFAIITTGTATGGYDVVRPFGPEVTQAIAPDIARIVTARPYDG